MKWLSIILVCSLFWNSVPKEKYTYAEKPILDWSDFMGTPPVNAHHAANVNSGIAFSYQVKKNNRNTYIITFEVRSEFYPQLSWKKNLNENNSDLLRHEQQHWNISEVYAHKLRDAFDQYRPNRNYKREIDQIFKSIESQRQQLQARYDRETNHGLNRQAQRDWEVRIAEMLFRL